MRSCHRKFFGTLIILIAVILGALSVTLNPKALTAVVIISRFFEVMIPFLGVMALLKFLFCHNDAKSCCKDGNCACCQKGACSTEEGKKGCH